MLSDAEYGLEGIKIAILFALVVVSLRALRQGVLANWRQDLFEVRNQLWDAMRDMGTLDAPAHRRLRQDFNGLLRFGASLNLVTLWWVHRTVRKVRTRPSAPLKTSDLSASAQGAILRAQSDLIRLVLNRVLFDTFPGCLVGWPVWLLYRSLRGIRVCRQCVDHVAHALKSRIQDWTREVEPAAEVAGKGMAPAGSF